MTDTQIMEWAQQFRNTAFTHAVHSALNGAWDDVRKDLRRNRITKEQADTIADKLFMTQRISEFLHGSLTQKFAEIAEAQC
jgi:hypothetical protein